MTNDASLGPGGAPSPPRGLWIGANLVLLVPSLVATWYFLVQPMWGLVAARQWQQIECEILESRTHRSRDTSGKPSSPTLAVTYRYQHAGSVHIRDDIDFFGGFALRESVLEDLRERFPHDTHRPCFVDPDDPARCVLDRDFRAAYLLGLIPLLLGLLSWSGLRHALWPPDAPAAGPVGSAAPGAIILAPPLSPRQRLGAAFFVSASFLGIVAAVSGPAELLGFPVVLVTLAAIGWVGYQLLVLANPIPHVTVSATTVALGDRFELTWRLDGATRRLRNFRISLECDEFITTATSKGHRRTRVERRVTLPIHGDAVVHAGAAAVQLPDDALCSFTSTDRSILWKLRFRGEIPRWPDLSEEYEITVLPGSPSPPGPH